MKARSYKTAANARRYRKPGEVVAVRYRWNGHEWVEVEAGVVPAEVAVEAESGEHKQPTGEFLADYWDQVTVEAERGVR